MRRLPIIVVVLAVLLAAGIAATPRPDSRGSRTITAVFADTAGLFVGNDVGVLGIPIGTVTRIEPDGADVRVTMEITDDQVPVSASAGAVIVSRSVATDRYVELTPVYHGGPQMKDGAVIPVSRTETPVDFDRVLSSLKQLGDGLSESPKVRHGLSTVIDTSAAVLKGQGDHINAAISGLSSAVAELHAQRGDQIGTFQALDSLSIVLARNDGTYRRFIANIADASDLLASERTNLHTALTTLATALRDLARFSSRHRTLIRTSLQDMTTVLRNTNHSQDDLREILETFPVATENMLAAMTRHPGRLTVQMDPAALTGQGPLVDKLCAQLGPICNSLSLPPDLGALLGLGGAGQ